MTTNENINKEIQIVKMNQTNCGAKKYNKKLKNSLDGFNTRFEQAEESEFHTGYRKRKSEQSLKDLWDSISGPICTLWES